MKIPNSVITNNFRIPELQESGDIVTVYDRKMKDLEVILNIVEPFLDRYDIRLLERFYTIDGERTTLDKLADKAISEYTGSRDMFFCSESGMHRRVKKEMKVLIRYKA